MELDGTATVSCGSKFSVPISVSLSGNAFLFIVGFEPSIVIKINVKLIIQVRHINLVSLIAFSTLNDGLL